MYCSKLKRLDIGKKVHFYHQVFYSTTGLETLILRSEEMCTAADVASKFLSSTVIYKKSDKGYIYVPDNLVEQYKVSDTWKSVAHKFKPLSELPE
jgi:hypothetical protein